jgi:glucose/arabinose dehydrogenase
MKTRAAALRPDIRPLALAGAVGLCCLASAAHAETRTIQTEAGNLRLETIATGLAHPWALARLPDGRMLVTERNPGQLRIVAPDGTVSAPVANVPEIFRFEGPTPRSQGGLFDVRLHPDFARNRQLFLSFSKPTERGASVAIVRATFEETGGNARLGNVATVFEMKPEDQDSSGLHFGGRTAISRDGRHLFLSIGDRRNISRSQDATDQAGSILRMTLDGKPAADNPRFAVGEGDEGSAPDPFLFAIGSRNSQALAVDPSNGNLWSVEHGPQGGDRADLVRPGVNLGWPFFTAGKDYSDAPIGGERPPEGMQAPTHAFAETVGPSGATFYTGTAIRGWQGNLLVGGLANEALMRLVIERDRVASVETIEIGRRVRDVRVTPDGAVWMVTDEEDGALLRLTAAR